jgi:hypothetical protein
MKQVVLLLHQVSGPDVVKVDGIPVECSGRGLALDP